MRICYIASPSVHTTRWVKYFTDNGHDVHLITTSKLFGEDIGRVKIHVINRYGSQLRAINYSVNTIPTILQFKALVRAIKPDIIHAQSITETTWLGANSGFHPFIVTPWGSDVLIAPKRSKISKRIVEYVLKRADLVTCDAEHIKEPLIKLGANSQKIELVYFGTDILKFRKNPKDDKHTPIIISVRSLKPIYNVETLIRTMPLVINKIPEAKFIIAGDGVERNYLVELAKSLGIDTDSIRFMGNLSEGDLIDYLRASSIYVSTSLSDAGLAASTAEAMACELAPVITDFGDNGKWVVDGVNGFLFPLRDSVGLASKLVQLLQDNKMRETFGKLSREIIVERNNWEKEMSRMEELYARLLKQ